MKKLLPIIIALALTSCNNTSKQTEQLISEVSQSAESKPVKRMPKVTLSDGTKCSVYEKNEGCTRIKTSRALKEGELLDAALVLYATTSSVYFHIEGSEDKGKEYAALIGQNLFVYGQKQIVKTISRQVDELPSGTNHTMPSISNDIITDKSKCTIIAQDFVKEKLKNPSNAEFVGNVIHEKKGNDSATILGQVDAQNSYGATVRTTYKVSIKYLGGEWTDKSNWELLNIIME